jgi:hypothetical protein
MVYGLGFISGGHVANTIETDSPPPRLESTQKFARIPISTWVGPTLNIELEQGLSRLVLGRGIARECLQTEGSCFCRQRHHAQNSPSVVHPGTACVACPTTRWTWTAPRRCTTRRSAAPWRQAPHHSQSHTRHRHACCVIHRVFNSHTLVSYRVERCFVTRLPHGLS